MSDYFETRKVDFAAQLAAEAQWRRERRARRLELLLMVLSFAGVLAILAAFAWAGGMR